MKAENIMVNVVSVPFCVDRREKQTSKTHTHMIRLVLQQTQYIMTAKGITT